MAEDYRLTKVGILIQQKKFAEAERLISDLLREDANNIHYLYLLAEVSLQQDQFERAISVADTAIGISPDEPYLFYIKARVAIQQDKFSEAEKHIQQAIEIDPYEADFFALLANIQLVRKQYEEALQTANTALEIDAENLLALNIRSTALNKLNRSEESFETIEGALREDPNNAYTHANYGWSLLEKGNHQKALQHFKESLSNDPTFDYAQAGMLEAMKASNPLYRLFLQYSFWIGNLNAKYQWGVILGFYFGFRILKTIAQNNENLQPYLIPLIVILSIIAFSTWIITPISNLFLRFNTYGQLLLNKKEKTSSNLVALSLCLSLIGLLLYAVFADEKMLTLAVFGFSMMLPLGTMFSPSKNKYALLIFTIVLAVTGLSAIALTFLTSLMFNLITVVYIFGFVAYQWVANYLLIKEGNH